MHVMSLYWMFFVQTWFAQFWKMRRDDGRFVYSLLILLPFLLQWQLGPFRPRKIGSTFEHEINIWIITQTHTHTLTHTYSHTHSFSYSHAHRLGLWHFFQNSDSFSELRSLENFKICSCLTWGSKNQTSWPFLQGRPPAAGENFFQTEG